MKAVSTLSLKDITLELIQPLCQETKRLFNEVRIESKDRIKLSLHVDKKEATFFLAEIYSIGKDFDGKMRRFSPSFYAGHRFVQKVPGRRFVANNKYYFCATDLTCLLVSFHWPKEQIIFADEDTKNYYRYILATFVQQTRTIKNRNNIEFFRPQDSEQFPLNAYQRKALKASIQSEGFGLFMEQGTGKTPIVIARICNEAKKKEKGLYRALIACPNNVRENWVKEFQKFATTKGRVTVLRGDKMSRVKGLITAMRPIREGDDVQYSVVICGVDAIATTWEAIKIVPWDLGVIDESHYIKNPSTRRWKFAKKFRDKCRKRMCLTGTPITNTMLDLYTQFEFMGEGFSGFSSYNAFRSFYGAYAEATQGQHSYRKLVGLVNTPMIQERLARQAFLIKKSEALPDLPKKMYNIREVDLSEEQKEAYENIATELIAEFESELASASDAKFQLVVNNILTKMLRLAQVTSGHVGIGEIYDEEGSLVQEKQIIRFDPNPKIEALVEILKEKDPHQKTIVWACFNQDIKSIQARLRYEGIDCVTYYGATSDADREIAVDRFNCDPKCRVFIGNARAGGTGVNLLGYDLTKHVNGTVPDTYCDHVIYFSQNWSATDRSQSEDRAHRRGTVSHVEYTDLVILGTIDMEIRERVVEKRTSALRIQDVKAIINRVMKLTT